MPQGSYSKEVIKLKDIITRNGNPVRTVKHPVDNPLHKPNIIEDDNLSKEERNEPAYDRVDIAFGSLDDFIGTSYKQKRTRSYNEKHGLVKPKL